MARRSPNYLDTIEYIGPRPQKPPKRPNFLAGWVVLLIAAAAVYFFGQRYVPLLRAEQTVASSERADVLIAELQPSARPGDRLAAAALQRTQASVAYEDAYYAIPYPNGDIPSDKGRAEDLVDDFELYCIQFDAADYHFTRATSGTLEGGSSGSAISVRTNSVIGLPLTRRTISPTSQP